jgi:hypothetical protein
LHSKLFKKQLIFGFLSIVVFLFSQINIVDIQIEELLYKFRRSGAVFKEKDKRKEKKKKVIWCQTKNNYPTHATPGGSSCRGE